MFVLQGDFLQPVVHGAERSWEYARENALVYALIGLVVIPTAPLFEYWVTEPPANTAWVRVIQFFCVVPILVYEYLPVSIKRDFSFYWATILLFLLPFSYTALLLHNAAATSEELHTIWMFEMLISIFMLVQFCSNIWLSSVLFFLGNISALLSLSFVSHVDWTSVYQNYYAYWPLIVSAFLFCVFTNQNVYRAQRAQMEALASMGGNIAHEIRTPLTTIKNLVDGTSRYHSELTNAYRLAIDHGLVERSLSKRKIEALEESLMRVEQEVRYAHSVIDILLYNTMERPVVALEYQTIRASALVSAACANYPYDSQIERKMVDFSASEEFECKVPVVLIQQVLFNLIKNAIRQAHLVENGVVSLRIVSGASSRYNCIDVIDNGPGIDRKSVKVIFERFYSTAPPGEGTGIGLSFCKTIMETIGGKITCDSTPGRRTRFRLWFPIEAV